MCEFFLLIAVEQVGVLSKNGATYGSGRSLTDASTISNAGNAIQPTPQGHGIDSTKTSAHHNKILSVPGNRDIDALVYPDEIVRDSYGNAVTPYTTVAGEVPVVKPTAPGIGFLTDISTGAANLIPTVKPTGTLTFALPSYADGITQLHDGPFKNTNSPNSHVAYTEQQTTPNSGNYNGAHSNGVAPSPTSNPSVSSPPLVTSTTYGTKKPDSSDESYQNEILVGTAPVKGNPTIAPSDIPTHAAYPSIELHSPGQLLVPSLELLPPPVESSHTQSSPNYQGTSSTQLPTFPTLTPAKAHIQDGEKYTGGFGGAAGVLGNQLKPGYSIQSDGSIRDPSKVSSPTPTVAVHQHTQIPLQKTTTQANTPVSTNPTKASSQPGQAHGQGLHQSNNGLTTTQQATLNNLFVVNNNDKKDNVFSVPAVQGNAFGIQTAPPTYQPLNQDLLPPPVDETSHTQSSHNYQSTSSTKLPTFPTLPPAETHFQDGEKYTGGFGGAAGVLGHQQKPGYAVQIDGSIRDPSKFPPPTPAVAVHQHTQIPLQKPAIAPAAPVPQVTPTRPAFAAPIPPPLPSHALQYPGQTAAHPQSAHSQFNVPIPPLLAGPVRPPFTAPIPPPLTSIIPPVLPAQNNYNAYPQVPSAPLPTQSTFTVSQPQAAIPTQLPQNTYNSSPQGYNPFSQNTYSSAQQSSIPQTVGPAQHNYNTQTQAPATASTLNLSNNPFLSGLIHSSVNSVPATTKAPIQYFQQNTQYNRPTVQNAQNTYHSNTGHQSNSYQTASSSYDGTKYTGGFGGPPGVLKPYDNVQGGGNGKKYFCV